MLLDFGPVIVTIKAPGDDLRAVTIKAKGCYLDLFVDTSWQGDAAKRYSQGQSSQARSLQLGAQSWKASPRSCIGDLVCVIRFQFTLEAQDDK